jgi:hypothetical protein
MAISETTHSPTRSAITGRPHCAELHVTRQDAAALRSTLAGLLSDNRLDWWAKAAVLSLTCQLSQALRP